MQHRSRGVEEEAREGVEEIGKGGAQGVRLAGGQQREGGGALLPGLRLHGSGLLYNQLETLIVPLVS